MGRGGAIGRPYDAPGEAIGTTSSAPWAEGKKLLPRVPARRLSVGSWSAAPVALELDWENGRLVLECPQGQLEARWADLSGELRPHGGDAEQLVLDLSRPPQFLQRPPPEPDAAGEEGGYVYTTDFTGGEASQVGRYLVQLPRGALSAHDDALRRAGIRVRRGGAVLGAGGKASLGPLSPARRKPPSSSPRLDAITLQEQLERALRERQARPTGICPVREALHGALLEELAGTIARDEPRRGTLLRRVAGEARMTIDAYRTVYEKSLLFGASKLSEAAALKGNLEGRIAELQAETASLADEVRSLTDLCESLEHRAQRAEAQAEAETHDASALRAEGEQLQGLLDALRPG
ncbi:hypothetical protein EMIHUDRAFT_105924 [Emiliania huxleyi CCMP1516]|uniref:Uncharacterized protein n=5 Tax=Emiliania huxleyi TaxID=2903 RepID=A0A0D3IB94_EMIH1|nr:hypothetical protein EMIHUDRAFT_105924 [Emiliania huxleyi CCMP1516]EOD08529.1 hypothetical protein EMIHUDRAFT_105924 [Emiliania huxleyi CCMP1516]|eukprot:XP_005760958.1 hypothetical protein EMIHUDRAFT_105924 [Emiliania huxleyi CCMP1516]